MREKLQCIVNGIFKENPVLRLFLGVCPALAVTTSAINGVTMGVAVMVVLICSNLTVSLLRNIIPDTYRVLTHLAIIAGFTTLVQMLISAILPNIAASLDIYLPLIAVNCIILSRVDTAAKSTPLPSTLDGAGMGIGFTLTLVVIGVIRELIGAGTVFGFAVTVGHISPTLVLLLPSGGLFVCGILIAVYNKLFAAFGKENNECANCGECAMKDTCEKGGEA